LKFGAAIERGKFLPVELEGNGQNTASWGLAGIDIAQLVKATRVLEHREVEVDSLFGVGVEPQKRCDARELFQSTHENHLACSVFDFFELVYEPPSKRD
jgi:hypothetical protein